MNIFHKILIILNFLLALATIWFGYCLFDQREIFKARMDTFETHAKGMATALQWGDYGAHPDQDRQGRYGDWAAEDDKDDQVGEEAMINDLKDYTRVHIGLKNMEVVAKDRVETMIENKIEWDKMDVRMAATNQTLATTRIKRDEWNQKFDDEVSAHDETKGNLQDAMAKISQLEGEIVGLKSDITRLEEDVTVRDQKIGELEVEIEELAADALRLKEELIACQTRGNTEIVEDVVARVVAFEPQWNFVVIDAGRTQAVKEKAIAMVHRGDKLVGKVNISRVGSDVSIGQVLSEWIPEGETIQPGDGIMF